MKARSKIKKGKRFEKFIANEIEKAGLGSASREDGSGSGLKKGDIHSDLPFLIEAKNQKQYRWFSYIDQAKEQADIGNFAPNKWALILRDPRTPETNPDCYVVMDMWEWLKLLKSESEPRVKEPDRELKYHLSHLKKVCQQVIRRI